MLSSLIAVYRVGNKFINYRYVTVHNNITSNTTPCY